MAEVEIHSTVDLDKALSVSRRVMLEAGTVVAREIEDYIKKQSSKPYPPASRDGNYPHRRTGNFVNTLRVIYDPKDTAIKVISGTADHHGVYLQGPGMLRDGTSRPYATKAFAARDWLSRLGKAARAAWKGL